MTTHPIAGTRPRGATPKEDELLAEQLQADPKERAEHVMLVDLGRNDLGRVARPGTVRVSKYMEVERYSHVLHLVSHVEAKLAPGLDALDALRSVFPAGTLSGAPKVRAMQLIAAAEGERRGLYGGAVGYLGYDGNLDTAITIRSAVLKDGVAHVHTGAGIVAGSVPGARVRGDRAQGRGAATGDRAGGRRHGRPAGGVDGGAPDADGRRRRRRPRPASGGRPRERPMILVIDNYDSFTFNLVQALQAAGAEVRVVRNDAIDRGGLEALADDPAADLRGIVISPGPSDPEHAGISIETVRFAAERRIPLLGVCLGMQSMGAAFGASIVRAPTLVHGEASTVEHDGAGLLDGMARRFMAARYHSLCIDPATLPAELVVTAQQRRRRRPDGGAPRLPADGGRPVPPRVRPDPGGAAPPGQLPPPGGRGRGGAARRGRRVLRDARPRRGGRGGRRAGTRRAAAGGAR